MNETLNEKNYLENISSLEITLKNNIIYEIYNKPNNIISTDEIHNSKEHIKAIGILLNVLKNNKIFGVIEKNSNIENLTSSIIHLLSSQIAFQKALSITYNYNEEKNSKIVLNKKEQENRIKLIKRIF